MKLPKIKPSDKKLYDIDVRCLPDATFLKLKTRLIQAEISQSRDVESARINGRDEARADIRNALGIRPCDHFRIG